MPLWFEVVILVAVVGAAVRMVRRFRVAGRTGMLVLAAACLLFLAAALAAIVLPPLVGLVTR